MLDEKKIDRALKEFFKNEYWKKYYDNAPSENCKRYIVLGFSRSLYDYPDFEERKKVGDELELSDWKYLYENEGNHQMKHHLKKKI